MKPERWRQISQLFKVALEREPRERAAFLEEACPEDEAMRAEVESLIASHEQAEGESFIESPLAGSYEHDPPAAADTQAEVVAGDTMLGPYRIVEKVGAGGMGTVYLARDTRLGRRVALKLLPAHMARDEELVRRFVQEARAASALNHPNIITVHEIGEFEGRRFIVTEFVEGRTLRERLAERRFPLDEALDICEQVAGALAKAHGAGIVHRDIKPENVMVDDDGHVKVLDFGIAKQVSPLLPSVDSEAPTNEQVNTASGIVLGTSVYMSPEQVRGQPLDERTDVWSLGCVLFEMLAGRTPFEAPTYGDLVVEILQREPPTLASFTGEAPVELEKVLRRALEKKRENRYGSARELRDDLRKLRRMGLTLENEADGAGGAHDPHKSTEIAPQQPLVTEQRKQVTVLFADLAGLSELIEGADAEEMGETLGALWRRVDGVVADFGGVVDKHVGDTVVALWGAREAREDDPERAVRAALAMQAAAGDFVRTELRRQVGTGPLRGAGVLPGAETSASGAAKEGGGAAKEGEGATAESAEPSPMRVGISTGLVLLGVVGGRSGEFTATGDAVNLASRLQQAAPVGGVLLSHDTYRHVRGVFSVHPPESMQFKGRAQAVEVYRVKRAKPRAFRVQTRGVEGVETRMIGRKGELRRLTDAVETVFEERELHVVTVLADAGLGKSRLLYEISNFVELLPDSWWVFNGRAGESMQALPYSLVRDVFSYRFEIQDSDSPAVAREKLERGLLAMSGAGEGPAAAEEVRMRAHFIGQLIGFDFSESRHLSGILDDARQIRDRAFHYAGQFFADIGRTFPIVLYLDDIHWADDGSLDFVDYLARNRADVPMFVCCLARPSLLERRPAWGEGQECHTRLTLQPLTKKESRQLVEEILRRARGVTPELRELVVGGAEGNPFYVEELIKMLIDQRAIVPGAEEWSVDASRLGEVQVPPTLTGVLQARLDKLTSVEKTFLQRASVVGRVFWDGAVRDLGAMVTGAIRRETVLDSPSPGDARALAGVTEVLESLRQKELIYRREASAFAGALEYTFKHALLRDVTYESVLRRERREYHRRAAEWLARQSGGRAGEYAGVVAEHYERAQETATAADWYGRAGRQARETYAPETAIKFYRKALQFLAPAAAAEGEAAQAARRVEWFEGLGEVLRVQARYAEAVEAYEAMRKAAEASGDHLAEARAWNEMALVQSSQGDIRATYESTQHAEELAREAGEDPEARVELARALNLQSQASSRLGDSRAAMMLADRALVLSTELREAGRRVRADSLKSLGMAYHMVGRFEQADHYKEQALLTFRVLGDRRMVGNLLNSLGETARLRGDYRTAFARYQEALAIAREIGNRNGEILYFSNLGGTRVGLGEYEAAESDLRQTIEMGSEAGYIGLSENYRFLAEALTAQGRLDEALEAALRALELGQEIENQEHIGEAWRVLGLIASQTHAPLSVGERTYDASACFAESVCVFERIRMEAEHARTLRDWARHELTHGDRGEGRQLWQRARDSFTHLGMTLEVERMNEEKKK